MNKNAIQNQLLYLKTLPLNLFYPLKADHLSSFIFKNGNKWNNTKKFQIKGYKTFIINRNVKKLQ